MRNLSERHAGAVNIRPTRNEKRPTFGQLPSAGRFFVGMAVRQTKTPGVDARHSVLQTFGFVFVIRRSQDGGYEQRQYDHHNPELAGHSKQLNRSLSCLFR
jgi:hypothetical protein